MKSSSPYLVVKDLKKHYGDGEACIQVLDGITATINKGEVCVMLGPSGSGKSTFLVCGCSQFGGVASHSTSHSGPQPLLALWPEKHHMHLKVAS